MWDRGSAAESSPVDESGLGWIKSCGWRWCGSGSVLEAMVGKETPAQID